MVEDKYNVFQKVTNSYIGWYVHTTSILTPINDKYKEVVKDTDDGEYIDVLSSKDGVIYGTRKGIPIRLVTICQHLGAADSTIVEVFLAHSKTTPIKTDFTVLADLATDGFWEWYPALNYEYMSVRFWSILGYAQADMDESPDAWKEKIHPESREFALENFVKHAESNATIPYYVNAKYRHKDGHVVHLVCRGTINEWLPDGSPWRMIGTHTDITDIVMKDALVAREQFISRMSHEIRSPLCAVLNECDILGDKHDLTVIKDACSQVLYIANDVLSLDKLKSKDVRPDPQECCPEDVINNTVKRHRGEYKKKGLRLLTSVNNVPELVMLDVGKFNQILDNLLSNALKYTAKGRVYIDTDFDDDSSMLITTVEDTGIGMTEDEKQYIFDEFYQGTTSMKGIGIGLYIVSVLCKLLGGFVEVTDTEPGRGTTLKFGVKVQVVGTAPDNEPLRKKSLRILVVDDIATNRVYMNRKLQSLEQTMDLSITEVVEAIDGKDAVRIFDKSQDVFDLVLMDCLMPIMDGFEATKRIHLICDSRNVARIPVIAVTASIADDIDEKCREAGMVYVVTKPFTADNLKQSLEAVQ
ncbi:FirrV-1-F1 [Feldmannia irregularis virus a]|uniref:histidine kinase n=1 Tax=Feldmannia irregularis virus a TaxID=231992 RepID=Q6XLV6_9PHYC|nr:FirrV-1-F1 [Feldmannia irregularis virus a]AAR26955.1 FirrV-1-F1 [Feldmannia irregularis virus a]